MAYNKEVLPIQAYQKSFIDFLLQTNALTFGDFVTKSGRKTPYFINTGKFNSGASISTLGSYYASHIVQNKLADADVIFGPAYKGVPLCLSAAIALHKEHGIETGYSFNRKEVKAHGDKGAFVGQALQDGQKVLLVEDVITAGTTLREIIPLLRSTAKVNVTGVVIAVDRMERGAGELSAVSEAEAELDLEIFPIVNIHQIVSYLTSVKDSPITEDIKTRIDAYLKEYGA